MSNFFTRPTSNNNNSERPEKSSSINLDVKASININSELLLKMLPWLLGGSIAAGSLTYGIHQNLPSKANENINNASPLEVVK